MRILRSLCSVVLVAMLVLVATTAQAQACLGFPLSGGSSAVMGTAAFPDHAKSFGVAVAHKMMNNVSLGASYSATIVDDIFGIELPTMHSVGGIAAYEIPIATPESSPALSLCPNAGFEYDRWDEVRGVSAPIGLGIGATIPIANHGAVLAPYVNPRFIWSRVSVDGESATDTRFGVNAGATVRVGSILFGPNFTKIGDSDVVFGIMAGFAF